MKEEVVAVVKSKDVYYPKYPFNPPKKYPEFKKFKLEVDEDNGVYEAVRESLVKLGLDKKNANTINWNPFKDLVKEGQSVVIKPNLVYDNHPLGIEGTLCTISHASIIRPIIDYVLLATSNNVEITLCDVPLQQASWSNLIKYSGIEELTNFYKNKRINIQLLDLRLDIAQVRGGVVINRYRKKRDPKGYIDVNLGRRSALIPIIKHYKKFEITDYEKGVVSKHHNFEKNEYLISGTMLNADLFINVPKLKTHRKTGITFALKNLIGINGDKSWIAHHRRGSVRGGGDEYPKFKFKNLLKYCWVEVKNLKNKWVAEKLLFIYRTIFLNGRSFSKAKFDRSGMKGVTEGSWPENDTIWRCIIDLNNIIIYSDKNGKIRNSPQRNYICIGDGIISGEGEGPMENTPKNTGVIVAGTNPLAIDITASKLIGFNPERINLLNKGKEFLFEKVGAIKVIKNKEDISFNFKVPSNWGWIKNE